MKSQRPTSPSKFSSEASDSPSKLNVPRRQRNQPSNRVGDIEFAVDINNSLIGQVRQLQAVISERDEALKAATLEKSRLELEAEGFSQRLKTLDESEQRYKDENWSLETQTHDLIAAAKDAAGREQKLQQTLAVTTSEKSEAQRDLDDLKQAYGRIVEDFAVTRKNHDIELATLRKNVNSGESEKGVLQRKLEEVMAQNQELAKAVAAHFRNEQNEPEKEASSELEDYSMERFDSEHSPPPSPTKGIPRNAMLESETLKSSLNHAHRMIQNLKANVHREKTEKLDLKRMLQEARDELEVRRREVGVNVDGKRPKSKSQQDTTRKGPRPNMLGQGRSSRTDVLSDEADWEDHSTHVDPNQVERPSLDYATTGAGPGRRFDASDAYQTANETDNSFETANERDSTTENEAFQTGAESFAGESSDELTETEGGMTRGGTLRAPRPSPLTLKKAGDRSSYGSTATTDDDESSVKTPVQTQPQRYRLKINRGARKQRPLSELLVGSDPSSAKNSPASFVGSSGQAGQSLFAELGELDGGDSDEVVDGTPIRSSSSHRSTRSTTRSISRQRSSRSMRRSSSSRHSTPGAGTSRAVQSLEEPPLPRIPLVDSGMMTDPWEPLQQPLGQADSDVAAENKPWKSSSIMPSTRQNPNVGAVQPNRSSVDSTPIVESTPPRTIWDQPLEMFASIIPTFGNSSRTTPVSAQPDSSREINAFQSLEGRNLDNLDNQRLQGLPKSVASTPEGGKTMHREQTPVVSQPETVTPLPILTLSPIRSLETAPTSANQYYFPQGQKAIANSTNPRDIGSEASGAQLEGSDTVRIIDTIFGSDPSKVTTTPQIAEDDTSRDFASLPVSTNDEKISFREISSNAVQQHNPNKSIQEDGYQPVPTDTADHSSQTMLSSEQIENMLHQKERYLAVGNQKIGHSSIMKPLSEIGAVSPPLPSQRFSESTDISKGKVADHTNREANTFAKVPKRPLSISSIRSRTGQYPPLPPDHQQAIAAAAQRAPSVEPSVAVMGPPLAPASAYRSNVTRPRTPSRPRTPNQQRIPSGVPKGATTPRARNSTRSQVSRRSSVSSFASELDERFNIRVDGMPMGNGFEGSTDPRMIQAITQTMIGEFLWKYTRRAGREDMSTNRHRRFFWVHPYTRTLYWSDKDPSTAGRAELRAKSVHIEAIQVVMDDNPMPPGLHRKSLIIITPGRSVKLTATTSQRHETWFNALSYLLLRAGPDGANVNPTVEDLEQYNPSYAHRASRTVTSRISLASFRSNVSQRSLTTRAPSGLSTRSNAPATLQRGQSTSVNNRYSQRRSSRNQGSISSRLSGYLRPGTVSVRDSVSGLNSRSAEQQQEQEGQEVNGAAHDSAEDLRHVIEQQEKRADQLENVRACCDGEFNFLQRSQHCATQTENLLGNHRPT